MQSCQSFYAICNRISLRRRTGASVKSSAPSAEPSRRLPIDSTCLRLKTSLFPFYLSCVYLYVASRSTLPKFALSLSLRREEKCPEIFCPLSLIPDGFPPSILPDFGKSVFSVRDRFSRNDVIKPVVYGQNSFAWYALIFQTYVTNNVDLFPGSNWRHESRVTLSTFFYISYTNSRNTRNFIFRCFPSLPLYHFYRSIWRVLTHLYRKTLIYKPAMLCEFTIPWCKNAPSIYTSFGRETKII